MTSLPRSARRRTAVSAAVLALLLPSLAACDQDDAPRARRADRTGSIMGGGPGMGTMSTDEQAWLVDMVAHHEDAIAAAARLAWSDDADMRSFGRRVVAEQSRQVEQMDRWTSRWYPEAPASTYEPVMSDLSQLSGRRLDQTFLREMIPHHARAVMMSMQLLRTGGVEHDAVAGLAATIARDQRAEMVWMRERLRSEQ